MNVKSAVKLLSTLLLCVGFANAAHAQMRITEWMYQGVAIGAATDSEFVEFTNVGASAINMSGWSFDDNSRAPGSQDLSAFGVVNAGESVILTQADAAGFRTYWGLGAGVKVIGLNGNNLGRSDEVNLYNGSTLVDRLTYNDQGSGTVVGPRTQNTSGRPGSFAALGANNASLWVFSTVGNADNAHFATSNIDLASPGFYAAPVPEPETYAMLLAGLGMLGFAARRRKQKESVAA